jgi:hypothetical protein
VCSDGKNLVQKSLVSVPSNSQQPYRLGGGGFSSFFLLLDVADPINCFPKRVTKAEGECKQEGSEKRSSNWSREGKVCPKERNTNRIKYNFRWVKGTVQRDSFTHVFSLNDLY